MTLQELLKIGRAPEDKANATIAQGQAMANMLKPFMNVVDVVLVTTVTWPNNSNVVPVATLGVPPDTSLYICVQVAQNPTRLLEFGVANWWRVVESTGMRAAVSLCLDVVNPSWVHNQELAALVAKLPGVVKPISSFVDPAVPSPDWERPINENWINVRNGDFSPVGTTSKSESGILWKKAFYSPFTIAWTKE